MQELEQSSRTLARQHLEDEWRVQSEIARARYEAASAQYRKLREERPEEIAPRPDDPLALARRAEARALAEYMRILRIFTELTVHGRLPEERATNGGGD